MATAYQKNYLIPIVIDSTVYNTHTYTHTKIWMKEDAE